MPQDLWQSTLIALHTISDSLIPFAYLIIPITLIYFIRRRRDLEKRIQDRTTELIAINKELQQEIHERKRVEQSLRESEERFRMVAETAPQIIWTLDANGNIDYCNQRWFDYIGFNCDGIQPQVSWVDVLHPEDKASSLATFENCLKTGAIYEAEYRIKRVDGVYRWHLGRAIPLKDSSGKIIKWFGSSTDIDDQKRVAAKLQNLRAILEERVAERTIELQKTNVALQETMKQLERSNQELAQFAYVASHDLQEPLRMVSSYTQLLERRYKDKLDEDANQFIHFAVDGAKRMQQLITALLDYSRLSTTNETPVEVNCNDILAQVLANLSFAIEETQVKITSSTLPLIRGEPVKLMQLFQNILSNAIKFRNAIAPEIQINAILEDKQWLFTIQDNGIGIDQEYFDKIFVIFQRLHGKHTYPGTGIGLAICKRIIEQHKGQIWVTSAVGKGTTFYFTLPAHDIQ